MKRSIIVIFAIAILGGIALVAKGHHTTAGRLVSPQATSTGSQASGSSSSSDSSNTPASYKDGTFTGDAAATPYGTVQIAVIISGGKIADINFLQMPSDQQHSREVTTFSEPLLKQTTIAKQSSNIDFVSGATSTSYGYQESLQHALDQAKIS